MRPAATHYSNNATQGKRQERYGNPLPPACCSPRRDEIIFLRGACSGKSEKLCRLLLCRARFSTTVEIVLRNGFFNVA